MSKNLYMYLGDSNNELLYYLKKILNPIKTGEVAPGILLFEVDDLTIIDETLKTLESDFYVDISAFIDDINLDKNLLSYAYDFLRNKNSGVYHIVDVLEKIVLDNNVNGKKEYKDYFMNKINEDTINTGLGFIKYGNAITASKELFIHRNTLNYRIDSIKKVTSLNLKNFVDQLVFYGLFK